MPIDFFKKDCCEGPISDAKFGIIDDQLGAKAHTDFSDESKWHATIKNNNNKKIFFTQSIIALIFLKMKVKIWKALVMP